MPNLSNECNMFVAHKAQDAGAAVPWFNGYPWPLTSYLPVANQWAGTETTPEGGTSITGWTLLPADALPQPGTIVAHPDPFDSGHVGIIDYDGRAVAAGTYTVNRAYPFFDGTSRQRKYNQ